MHKTFSFKSVGIETHQESQVYLHKEACAQHGLDTQSRVQVACCGKTIIATLNMVGDNLLTVNEIGLSGYAKKLLCIQDGSEVGVSFLSPPQSLSYIRSKIYNHTFTREQLACILKETIGGQLSDVHVASFLTTCAERLSIDELVALTSAMVGAGEKLQWQSDGLIVDKHCIGGIPGNRVTPIVVSIVASYGLRIPKTSSRSITSPAGTADTVEVFTNVAVDTQHMQEIVETHHGCFIWGGAMSLSPADDVLIHIERELDLDSNEQLIASVLSKKLAVGSQCVLIDIPVGPTAKVRDMTTANKLQHLFCDVGSKLGLKVKVVITDGSQPIGRGMGPTLEARDVLYVLQNDAKAPQDLKEKALMIAGHIIDFVTDGGYVKAKAILESGQAFAKFKAICQAQGRYDDHIPQAPYVYTYLSPQSGVIQSINNRDIAHIARMAGAPKTKTAGLDLFVKQGEHVEKNAPLFAIHSANTSMLDYAKAGLEQYPAFVFEK